MSKKQTRRSISVSGELYQRIKTHCGENGQSMSAFVEGLARDFIGTPQRDKDVARSHEDAATRAVEADGNNGKTVDTTSIWPHRIAPKDDHKHNTSAEEFRIAERRAGNIFTF